MLHQEDQVVAGDVSINADTCPLCPDAQHDEHLLLLFSCCSCRLVAGFAHLEFASHIVKASRYKSNEVRSFVVLVHRIMHYSTRIVARGGGVVVIFVPRQSS
jgi:hypothetical protein